MNTIKQLTYFVLVLLLFTSCDEEENATIDLLHPVTFAFTHTFDDAKLMLAEQVYTNAAGNEMSVENLQYVISDIQIHSPNGTNYLINDYHFVDINDETTLTFDTGLTIEEGEYTKISFVFGLRGEKNQNGVHTDLNALSWSFPEMLGGGYHFMKLEGKFKNTTGENIGYATHMGTAREVRDDATIFHENHIYINLPDLSITTTDSTVIVLNMDIKKWYENPVGWDLNELWSMIMPNYEAQTTLRANGKDVWSAYPAEVAID